MSATCYLCGRTPADTRDHIPPRCLFPEPRPSNLITVACCRRCNGELGPEDDFFRLLVSSSVERSVAGDQIWDSKVVTNTVRRLPLQVDHLLASCQDQTAAIGGDARDVVAFGINRPRLDRYAVRLVKGLIRHHFPDFDYDQSVFQVRLAPLREQGVELLGAFQGLLGCEVRGSGVFRYHFGLTDSGQSGVWIMTFYEGITIAVFHSNNGFGET